MSKECKICHRKLINGSHAGMCAGCFANVKDIVFVCIMPVLCFLYVISPIDLFPELFAGKFGFIDDILVGIAAFVYQVVLIVGVFKRKRPIM